MCASDMTQLVIRPCEHGPRWTCHRGVGGMMQIVRPEAPLEGAGRQQKRGSWPTREAAIIGGIRALFALRAASPCTETIPGLRRHEETIGVQAQREISTTWGPSIAVQCVEWIVCRSPD